MKLLPLLSLASALAATACGRPSDTTSAPQNLLVGGGWSLSDSPYALLPGQTIAVCNAGVASDVNAHVIKAVRIWLEAGGRDERLHVKQGCSGDRVIKLQPVPNNVPYYGQASPLNGNVYKLDVPPKWAGHWTANHEVGHVFGFAHNFDVISIMNSEDNGANMNGGHLSPYDFAEVRRMLGSSAFNTANAAWGRRATPAAAPASSGASCLGVDRVTRYTHGTVTTYRGERFTCRSGVWSAAQ